MLVDTNTYIGHWAFRPLPWHTADDLLRAMDAHGIDRAFVSSASAILYRNSHAGNEELHAEARAHPDRLVPFAVINPTYADWQHDLAICHEEFGARGVRLYPKYHRYQLSDANGKALIREAAARKMIISVPLRVEDNRQRSWLLDVPDVTAAEVADAAKAHPEARFLPVNGFGYLRSAFAEEGSVQGDFGLEMLRPAIFMGRSNALGQEIQRTIEKIGADHVVFGSGMPFTIPEVLLLKLEVLNLPKEASEAIRWRNAVRLLE
ncbi:MAG: metal-dependent hydrolase [Armatimonadetes bacterium]|nr:metal-dependent hydrolase [Armatimonadota bacterium]